MCSNVPAPRSIEKCNAAIAAGRRVALIYLDRPGSLLRRGSVNACDIRPFPVTFRKVQWERLTEMRRFYRWLKAEILPSTTPDCDVYFDSLDLLAIAKLAGKGRRTFRYEVRDLNAVQIERGTLPFLVRNLERLLLRNVDKLILTCDEYYQQYYQRIYPRQYEIVENYPSIASWNDFIAEKRPGSFVIGYVGVIRYLRCLKTLVAAARILREKGLPVVLKFSGGGAIEELKAFAGSPEWIEYTGPFDGSEITEIYRDVDLSFSVYDPAVKNVRYAMPNKFYESILAGIPILVAKGTFLEKRVLEAGIGTSTDPYSPQTMAGILQEACHRKGWFRNSVQALKQTTRITQEEHDATVRRAVVG